MVDEEGAEILNDPTGGDSDIPIVDEECSRTDCNVQVIRSLFGGHLVVACPFVDNNNNFTTGQVVTEEYENCDCPLIRRFLDNVSTGI